MSYAIQVLGKRSTSTNKWVFPGLRDAYDHPTLEDDAWKNGCARGTLNEAVSLAQDLVEGFTKYDGVRFPGPYKTRVIAWPRTSGSTAVVWTSEEGGMPMHGDTLDVKRESLINTLQDRVKELSNQQTKQVRDSRRRLKGMLSGMDDECRRVLVEYIDSQIKTGTWHVGDDGGIRPLVADEKPESREIDELERALRSLRMTTNTTIKIKATDPLYDKI